MLTLLAIAALAIVPQDCVARDTVSTLETNWVYDPANGRLVCRQLCGIEEDDRYRFWRYQNDAAVRVWRDHDCGGWVALWDDQGTIRVVRAMSFKETHTGYDPEQYDLHCILPADQRRKLKGR